MSHHYAGCVRRGDFAEVTSAKVTSEFESWQVLCHTSSNLYVKLHTLALYMIIASLLSPCIAYVAYAACAACVPIRINWLLFQ